MFFTAVRLTLTCPWGFPLVRYFFKTKPLPFKSACSWLCLLLDVLRKMDAGCVSREPCPQQGHAIGLSFYKRLIQDQLNDYNRTELISFRKGLSCPRRANVCGVQRLEIREQLWRRSSTVSTKRSEFSIWGVWGTVSDYGLLYIEEREREREKRLFVTKICVSP